MAGGDENRGQPLLFLLGANHRSAPVELRELLYIAEEPLAALLPALKDRFGFLELAALSTCNRFELMGVVRDQHGSAQTLMDAYLELHRHHGALHQKYSDDQVRDATYLHSATRRSRTSTRSPRASTRWCLGRRRSPASSRTRSRSRRPRAR
jgi:hypothetical protein